MRQNLKFNDGTPLTAVDVKWSWERALSKSTGMSRANHTLGLIEGADAVVEDESRELSGVEVVDDRTLVVRLSEPRSDFAMLVSDPVASVLKRENVEKWGIYWTNRGTSVENPEQFHISGPPVGAGPFRLASFRSTTNYKCGLLRNEHYWGRPAYLDGISFIYGLRPHDDESGSEGVVLQAMSHFEDGAIDYLDANRFGFQEDSNQEIDGIRGSEMLTFGAWVVPRFMALNNGETPFDDPNVRISLAAAANLESEDEESAVTRWGLLPPSIRFSDTPPKLIARDAKYALRLLRESRYAESLDEITPIVNHIGYGWFWPGKYVPDACASDLGFAFEELHSLDWDLAAPREWAATYVSEPVLYPSPYAVFRMLLSPFRPGHSSPEWLEVERMIRAAASEPDAARRLQRYEKIEQQLIDQALVIPVAIDEVVERIIVQPWVHGLSRPKYTGSMFHDVWLDDSAPDRPLPEEQ